MPEREARSESYCLGGCDLEMQVIGELLRAVGARVFDRGLQWGEAVASAYGPEIEAALAAGDKAVLIELRDDLPAGFPRERLVWIDHHGPRARADRPTALEQVFARLGLPADQWPREFELIAANDRGHLAATRGASLPEVEVDCADLQQPGPIAEEPEVLVPPPLLAALPRGQSARRASCPRTSGETRSGSGRGSRRPGSGRRADHTRPARRA